MIVRYKPCHHQLSRDDTPEPLDSPELPEHFPGIGPSVPAAFRLWPDRSAGEEAVGKDMGKLTAVAGQAALANLGTWLDGNGLFLRADRHCGASWALLP